MEGAGGHVEPKCKNPKESKTGRVKRPLHSTGSQQLTALQESKGCPFELLWEAEGKLFVCPSAWFLAPELAVLIY